jgi:peptidoglycan hydrolase-like protein with peptidoglycan-binding domain
MLLAASCACAHAATVPSPRVAALQLILFKRGYYRGPLDGVAGPRTRRATKRFQRRHGLLPDGVAGSRTRAKLGRWARHELGTRVLRRGRRGWDVAELQFLLRRNGFFASIDGVFGLQTQGAVYGLQRALKLRADGIVDRRTVAALRLGGSRVARLATQSQVRGEIDRWSRHYGVDPKLACALAWMESGHQPNLTSRTGAWGVFQVEPSTWTYVERVLADRTYPRTMIGNVRVGLLYFRHLLHRFGAPRRALAAWYVGPARVRRHGVGPQGAWFAETVLALRARC